MADKKAQDERGLSISDPPEIDTTSTQTAGIANQSEIETTVLQPVAIDDVPEIDIADVKDWMEPPIVTFDQHASLQIARWIVVIFGGVYFFSFIFAFCMLFALDNVTFDSASEVIRFMLSSIVPLVTLAVGYYLGDRSSSSS